MKRILLLYLTAILLPSAANAEPDRIWMMVRYGVFDSWGNSTSLEKIEMKSMEQCETQGALWMGTKKTQREAKERKKFFFGYSCLRGK
tara:strand:+ start:278 stop:541 length:264 start_codon:yes stop_codon:yes gene_type:complete